MKTEQQLNALLLIAPEGLSAQSAYELGYTKGLNSNLQPPSEIVDKLVEVGNDLAELVQYYEKRSYRIGAAKKSNKAITDWKSALTAYHKWQEENKL